MPFLLTLWNFIPWCYSIIPTIPGSIGQTIYQPLGNMNLSTSVIPNKDPGLPQTDVSFPLLWHIQFPILQYWMDQFLCFNKQNIKYLCCRKRHPFIHNVLGKQYVTYVSPLFLSHYISALLSFQNDGDSMS